MGPRSSPMCHRRPHRPAETKDLEIDGADYRGHLLELSRDGGERLLLLGPSRAGDLLGLELPGLALLAGFLLLGSWRSLTDLPAPAP